MARINASSTENIRASEPRIPNHNVSIVCFSYKRKNVLVYIASGFTEKHCLYFSIAYLNFQLIIVG